MNILFSYVNFWKWMYIIYACMHAACASIDSSFTQFKITYKTPFFHHWNVNIVCYSLFSVKEGSAFDYLPATPLKTSLYLKLPNSLFIKTTLMNHLIQLKHTQLIWSMCWIFKRKRIHKISNKKGQVSPGNLSTIVSPTDFSPANLAASFSQKNVSDHGSIFFIE